MRRLPALLLCFPLVAAEPRTGHEVLAAMHARWAGKWYRTLSFAQHTFTTAPDGKTTKGVWYEALQHPGLLRIDYAPLEDRAGLICAQDKIFHFKGGQQTAVLETWNHLAVLIGDVYCQDVARSAFQLGKLGFDLGKVHRATWKGRACWVVGAGTGEPEANQFWVDAETHLLWRVLRRDPASPAAPPREVQIQEYRTVEGFPIAARLDFLQAGKRFFSEDYFDIRVNVPLAPELFCPEAFASTRVPAAPK